MASEKAVKYFEKTFAQDLDFEIRLRDWTDNQLRLALVATRAKFWEDIEDYLAMRTNDPDVLARMKGFDNAEHRREVIESFKKMQEEWDAEEHADRLRGHRRRISGFC